MKGKQHTAPRTNFTTTEENPQFYDHFLMKDASK